MGDSEIEAHAVGAYRSATIREAPSKRQAWDDQHIRWAFRAVSREKSNCVGLRSERPPVAVVSGNVPDDSFSMLHIGLTEAAS